MRTATAIGLMLTTGIAAPLLSLAFDDSDVVVSIWYFAGLGFLVGAFACWLAPSRLGQSMVALISGIAVGLFGFGLVEWFVFSRDPNLLPVAIVLWEAVLGVPAALGIFICRALMEMQPGLQ